MSPRQERFLIHVHKAYFQEIWRGDSFVLVPVSSGKPSGINNELLHSTKKSFIFSLRFVVNAEKKIMRCVSVYVIGSVSCSCGRIPRAVEEEVMWAFESSTLARGIGHNILPEEMGVKRAALHSHS